MDSSVVLGGQTTFEIVVRNTGEADLTDVKVREVIPEGLVYDSYRKTSMWNHSLVDGEHVWTFNGVLKVGQVSMIFVTFNTTRVGNFTNVVVVSSNETDNKTGNNTTRVLKPDFEVSKIALDSSVVLGGQTTFEIVVRNTGEADLTDVKVREVIPEGLVYDSYRKTSMWNHSLVDGEHVWTFNGVLKVGQVSMIFVTFNTTRVGNFTNVVVVSSNETDNKTGNNTTRVLKPDFEVSKIALDSSVVLGGQTTFEIVVRNTGEADLTDVKVREVIPEGLIYDSYRENPLWIHSAVDDVHIWTFNGVLKVGQFSVIYVTFNTTREGNFTNIVVVSSNETDNKTSNNTTKVLKPDIDVKKVAHDVNVTLGHKTTFEIVVQNIGETDLTDVKVREVIPEGLIYDSYRENPLWSHSVIDGEHIWTFNGVLKVGQLSVIYVTFNTTRVGNFTNIVVVSSNETDNKTSNNTTTVLKPGIEVEKISINSTVVLGGQTTFEIVVRNTGETDLTDVKVREVIPEGLTYDSYMDNGLWSHSIVDDNHIWTLNGILSKGEYAGFYVVFNTTRAGNFTNVVIVSSNETDNKTSNNTTKVLKPEMSVEKITLTPNVVVGNQTIFEIVVHNTGEVPLDDVFVIEESYDGLIYDSFINNRWTHSLIDGKNQWNYNGVLAPGEYEGFFVIFNTTREGNFTNIVIAGSNKTNNTYANNTTEVTNKTENKTNDTVESFDLFKNTITPVVIAGNQVTFEIVIHNTGNATLNNMTINEISYDGLIYDHYEDHLGFFDKNNNLSWTMNSPFYPGEYVGFYVVFNTTTNGTFVNVISSGNETANSTVNVLNVSYTIDKIALNSTVRVGDEVVFEIVVHNDGQAEIENLTITEYSFEGLEYLSYVDYLDAWTYDNLTWTLNRVLNPGEYLGFFVRFKTLTNGSLTNVVTSENKTANDTVEVFKPSYEITKVAINRTVKVGDEVTFEIVVYNNGVVDIDNLTVEELDFDGLTYLGFVDNTEMWINDAFTWSLNATLSPGEYSVFYVVFNTTHEGNFTNIIQSGNKTSNDTVEVLRPEMSVVKVALDSSVVLGDQTTFEIVVHNTGKVDLTDVVVREEIPDGLIYDSFADNGLWNHSIVNGVHTWAFNGVLKVGQFSVIYVTFNTTRIGEFINAVVAGSNETEEVTNNTTVKVLQPKLIVEKISLTPYVYLGNQTIFEIIVHNVGEVDLDDVFVIEDSYDGLIYDSFANNHWTHSVENGKNKWTFNSVLKVGEFSSFYVIFNTTDVGVFTNTVIAASNKTNNTHAENTTEVIEKEEHNKSMNSSDVESIDLIKTTITPVVIVGQQVTFQIIVHNNGTVTLNGITINEDSFEGLIYDHFEDYSGLFTKNNNLSWTMNSPLYPGEYAGFYVIFNTTTNGTFINTISSGNKTANDTVEVLKPSYEIEKIALNQSVRVGDEVVFEIVVHNNGQVAIDDLEITESYFEGLDYLSYVDYLDIWTYDNLTWHLNRALTPGEYIGFFVRFKTTTNGTFINVITSGNKTANDTVEVIKPSHDLEKITLNRTVQLGDEVTFEIIVHNNGPIDITDLTVNEVSFDGLNYLRYYDNTGMWVNDGLTWSLNGVLAPDAYSSFYVVFNTISEGTFINVAASGNKTANDTVEVLKPSYEIEKVAINKTVTVGEEVIFEIIVHNDGQTLINNIEIEEYSFDGLTYSRYVDNDGIWIYNNLKWNLNATLRPGQYVVFYVIFKANEEGNFTNMIRSGNKSTNCTVEVLKPSFTIEKITMNKTVNLGDSITFEIVVHNTGKTDLNNITVVEELFEGLIYDHYIDSTGWWTNNGLSWTLNKILSPGEYSRFYVVFNTTRAGNFTNVISCDNLTANSTVEVIPKENKTIENKTIENETIDKTPKEVVDISTSKETGNPIFLILLVLLNLVILRRRK